MQILVKKKKEDKDLDNTITVHKLAGDRVKHFSRGTRYKNEQFKAMLKEHVGRMV